MAHNLKYAATLAQAKLDQITTAIGNAGLLRIYDGSQPATPDTAISTQTLLSQHTCGSPFAAASAAGPPAVLTANAIANASASATSTAAWFRVTTSGGTAKVDGTAGVGSGFDLNLDSTSFTSGQTVSITALTITAAN